ncbi:hypothetical protein [Rhizobium sp. FY34]|uniref:hypothetical protein n=1 Tax=Rhizobium sp. FY34 TaxID=2562309 RepID=UPI0010C0A8C2|nr:hypothetical protein [Rhizobium sp. FY34]
MPPHRFSIGQLVRLTKNRLLSRPANQTYTIQAPLPWQGDQPQYRLRDAQSNQERVALEQDLERINLI